MRHPSIVVLHHLNRIQSLILYTSLSYLQSGLLAYIPCIQPDIPGLQSNVSCIQSNKVRIISAVTTHPLFNDTAARVESVSRDLYPHIALKVTHTFRRYHFPLFFSSSHFTLPSYSPASLFFTSFIYFPFFTSIAKCYIFPSSL